MHYLFACSALLLTAAQMAAADTPAAKPKPAKGSPQERVCKRETVTGSLAGSRRVCATRAEWQEQAEAAQRAAQDVDERGRITTCTAPGGC